MNPALCYLDNNATTRVAPEVVEAMLPFLQEHWGNASSVYGFGRRVAQQIDEARAQVAALIHADPANVIFTSGGTESINAVLRSAVASPGKRHMVTTAVEHSATLNCCRVLEAQGCEVTLLPVDTDGALALAELERSLRPDTALVSVMWANNETGVVFPIADIAALCRARQIPVHTDAVQAAGKLVLDVDLAGVDFLTLSAHKLYAPKGMGALFVGPRARFQPLMVGGGQEHGRRAGTENVPGIIGFGRAAELAATRLTEDASRIGQLRDRMEDGILASVSGVRRNGPRAPRLPNTSNLAFDGIEAEAALLLLDPLGICASSGSACMTGSLEPSHVLTAMGFEPARARSSLRFSLGRYTTAADVDYLLAQLPAVIAKLRAASILDLNRNAPLGLHGK